MDQIPARAAGFPARLRALREVAGLSQHDLAAAVSIDRSALTRIEAGERGAKLHLVERLAAVLQVSPGHLAFGPDPSDRIDAVAEALIQACLEAGPYVPKPAASPPSAASRQAP